MKTKISLLEKVLYWYCAIVGLIALISPMSITVELLLPIALVVLGLYVYGEYKDSIAKEKNE